jgi:hypothetical protein
MYAQGDVLLIRAADDLTPEAVVVPRHPQRGIVLAEGEATGHAHAIADDAATLYATGDTRLLLVREPVRLRHEEHAPIEVPPGLYRVRTQREYSPRKIEPVRD